MTNEEIEALRKITLKQYVSKNDIRKLQTKIHNMLDANGITRAYQIMVDEEFEKLLESEE